MKLTQNQKLLIKEGIFWAIYYNLTSMFLIAFALALGATNTIIGIAGALPYLAAILSQIPGAKLTELYSRIHINIVINAASRLLWVPIVLIPIFFKAHPLLTLIIYYFLSQFAEWLSVPAWTSLAGDFVSAKYRGRYFARRNMLMGIFGMTASVLGAAYLDLFPKTDYTGFSTIFMVGILFGLWSAYLYSKMREPAYTDKKYHKMSEFFKIKGEFRKFVLIMLFFNFAFMLSSPFFIVYMLKNIGMSYTMVMIAFAVGGIAKIISHPHWGRVSDKIGDKPVAIFSIFGTALIPFIYLFATKEAIWIVFAAQIVSGIVWAGVLLSSFNLLLDLSPHHRAIKAAKYQMLTSLPLIVAPIVGGYIADNLVFVLSGIPLVFGISFLLRAASAVFMFAIKEPRIKKKHRFQEIIHEIFSIHPVHKTYNHITEPLRRIIKIP
ncbi:MFS transporter [Candidatus Woesearchaeota archaeon]|nr:MFS transporter [Candidatus Woesearchaeota archaeon]MBW3005177.1 MFS transporter [Candidatus Woesearchaeota archaeon]